MIARFHQARRHTQGMVELGYIALQYMLICKAVGMKRLAVKTHLRIFALVAKLHTVHVISCAQSFAVALTIWGVVLPKLGDLLTNFPEVIHFFATHHGISSILVWLQEYWGGLDSSWKGLCWVATTFSVLPGLFMLNAFFVVRDIVSGHYYSKCRTATKPLMRLGRVEEDGDDADIAGGLGKQVDVAYENLSIGPSGAPSVVTGPLSHLQQIFLAVRIYTEYWMTAQVLMFVFILPPTTMAAWSLLRRGTALEYIVAPKPE